MISCVPWYCVARNKQNIVMQTGFKFKCLLQICSAGRVIKSLHDDAHCGEYGPVISLQRLLNKDNGCLSNDVRASWCIMRNYCRKCLLLHVATSDSFHIAWLHTIGTWFVLMWAFSSIANKAERPQNDCHGNWKVEGQQQILKESSVSVNFTVPDTGCFICRKSPTHLSRSFCHGRRCLGRRWIRSISSASWLPVIAIRIVCNRCVIFLRHLLALSFGIILQIWLALGRSIIRCGDEGLQRVKSAIHGIDVDIHW